MLIKQKVMNQKKIDQVYADVNEDIERAIAFAESSPYPTPEDLLEDVYNVGASA